MNVYSPAPTTEPVGIVISRGDRAEPTPKFSAWFYAPSPVDADEIKSSKAA